MEIISMKHYELKNYTLKDDIFKIKFYLIDYKI